MLRPIVLVVLRAVESHVYAVARAHREGVQLFPGAVVARFDGFERLDESSGDVPGLRESELFYIWSAEEREGSILMFNDVYSRPMHMRGPPLNGK